MSDDTKNPWNDDTPTGPRKEEHLLIIGDEQTFIQRCLQPPSSFIKLVPIEKEFERLTGGKSSTLQEYVEVTGGAMLFIVGSYKDEETFLKLFDLQFVDQMPFVCDVIDADDDPEFADEPDFYNVVMIGGRLMRIKLQNRASLSVLTAMVKGFPGRYVKHKALVRINGGGKKELSSGVIGQLDMAAFHFIFRTPDDEAIFKMYETSGCLYWGNTSLLHVDGEKTSVNTKFTVFKRKGFQVQLVPVPDIVNTETES